MPPSGCSALHGVNPNLKKVYLKDRYFLNWCTLFKLWSILEVDFEYWYIHFQTQNYTWGGLIRNIGYFLKSLWNIFRPCVAEFLFIVICTHQKIKALFSHINFDYMRNFVKNFFVFLSVFFLLSIKKDRKIHTKHNCTSKFTLMSM